MVNMPKVKFVRLAFFVGLSYNIPITKRSLRMSKKYTAEELNSCSKEMVIELFLSVQDQLDKSNHNIELLIEQMKIANQKRFGRSSEKLSNELIEGQLNLFNEAEAMTATTYTPEVDIDDVVKSQPVSKPKRHKGQRDENLEGLPVEVITHELDDEKLDSIFKTKPKRLPDEVYKRLKHIPAKYVVEEHHVAVYAGTDNEGNERIVKADRPASLFRNSIATPSIVSAILNGKYVNALPLYRIEQEFNRNDIKLHRQVMASWTIKVAENYLSLLYDYLHREIYNYHVLQADETPVEVTKDGRPAGSKSYMWVYRTGKMNTDNPIVLYEYQKTRNTSHPREFLKDYQGVVVTDGYQVYHTLDKEYEALTIAGCWSHSRRRFANVVKSLGKDKAKDTLANDALKQIGAIYKLEESFKELTSEERLKQRQLIVKPLVEAFFAWVKEHQNDVPAKSETGKGLSYCISQEKYLKVFLEDGEVPMDNNAAEQAIRGFCIGKQNWHLIDTIDGAKASAIIYSIAETAKANNLKPYDYFEHLLTIMPEHMYDKSTDFLQDLLPWSEKLPENCRKSN